MIRTLKYIGEFLFVVVLVDCVWSADVALVHKGLFLGILVLGGVAGWLEHRGKFPRTPYPVYVVAALGRSILSLIKLPEDGGDGDGTPPRRPGLGVVSSSEDKDETTPQHLSIMR